MAYKVKLEIYEGPFDLLVSLIEKAAMNIYDIQVSEITRQYLSYIEEMQSRDLALSGEFMVLAAALIELKSKMLLPRAKPEEMASDTDPRAELVQKLLEYKKYKAAADLLMEQEEYAGMLFEKPTEDLSPYTDEPDIYIRMDIEHFINAFRAFIVRKRRVEEVRRRYERIEQQRETVESKIASIKLAFRTRKAKVLRFRELLENEGDRYEEVLTFMSVLEMVRSKLVRARQRRSFSEISVELRKNGEAEDA
ncbi:MAG: segregation/condensation protein A [Clostridiales Family XIII bacterium]|jgi:segregation and condensation protein A|nr:segregation/condensation protein A [Clostridiales Family XIII bacterium]